MSMSPAGRRFGFLLISFFVHAVFPATHGKFLKLTGGPRPYTRGYFQSWGGRELRVPADKGRDPTGKRGKEKGGEGRGKGAGANRYTYNALINACVNAGNVKKGVELMAQMQREKLQPDVVTFTSLSKSPQASEFLGMMKRMGVSPNPYTLSSVISRLSRGDPYNGWATGLGVYLAARNTGKQVTTGVNNAMLYSLNRGSQWSRTLQIFQQTHENERDSQSWAAAVIAACRVRRYTDCLELAARAEGEGLRLGLGAEKAISMALVGKNKTAKAIARLSQAIFASNTLNSKNLPLGSENPPLGSEISEELPLGSENSEKLFLDSGGVGCLRADRGSYELFMSAAAKGGMWDIWGRKALNSMKSNGLKPTQRHMSKIVRELKDRPLDAQDAFDAFWDTGVNPDSHAVAALIRSQAFRGKDFVDNLVSRLPQHTVMTPEVYDARIQSCLSDWESALRVLSTYPPPGPGVHAYVAVGKSIDLAGKLGDSVKILRDRGRVLGLRLDPTPYEGLMIAAAREGKWREAVKILKAMREVSVKVGKGSHRGVIRSWLEAKEFLRMERILYMMDDLDIEIDNISSINLMQASIDEGLPYGQAGDKRTKPKLTVGMTAEEVTGTAMSSIASNTFRYIISKLPPGQEPPVKAHTLLLQAFLHDDKWGDALRVFDRMIARVLKPDVKTCNRLIMACLPGARVTQALNIARAMRRHAILLNEQTYNSLLSVCAAGGSVPGVGEGHWRAAVGVFEDFCNGEGVYFGASPSVTTYTLFLKALLESGRTLLGAGGWQDALNQITAMRNKSLKPNMFTRIAVENGALHRPAEECYDILTTAEKIYGIELSERTLNRAAGRVVRFNLEKGLGLWKRVRDQNKGDKERRFIALACAKSRRWQQAAEEMLALYKSDVSVDSADARIVINAVGSAGKFSLAEILFRVVGGRGIIDYATLIQAAAKARDWQSALGLRKELASAGFEVPESIDAMVLKAYGAADEIDKALVLFDSLLRAPGGLAGPDIYASVLHMLGRAGRWEEAVKTFIRMSLDRVQPNIGCFQGLVIACQRGGRAELAAVYLNYMEEAIIPNMRSSNATDMLN